MTTYKHERREQEEQEDAEYEHHLAGDCLGVEGCSYCIALARQVEEEP